MMDKRGEPNAIEIYPKLNEIFNAWANEMSVIPLECLVVSGVST